MVFKYFLFEKESGPYIESFVHSNIVDVKIIDSGSVVFHEKCPVGFWCKSDVYEKAAECIIKLKPGIRDDEAKMIFGSGIEPIRRIYSFQNIPLGFAIGDQYNGLFKIDLDKEKNEIRTLISYTPIWPLCQYYNLDTDTMMLDLVIPVTDKFSIVTLPQKDVFQRKGIMEVANHGALLEESKASQMINWIANYMHHNDIPTHYVFERFGWKEGLRFVAGDRMISDHKIENVKIINVPQKTILGMNSAGTVGEWIRCTEKMLRHRRARFKCYAACAAPILKLINQKSFIIHDYGESRTGKTKTTEVAISIWGDPDKLNMSSFGTTVGKERYATMFNDLPISLDETSSSKDDENIVFIYLIANETGKLRGMKDGGLQETANWKTVAFTTGEAPLTTDKSFTGMMTRTIEIYGGLGAHDSEAIDEFKSGVENCYGVLAPYIIQEIIDNYPKLQHIFKETNVKFSASAAELTSSLNGVGGSAASMFAAIALGGLIFEEVLHNLGGQDVDAGVVCGEVFQEYIKNMSESGYAYRAREYFMSWYHTKEKYFLFDMVSADSRGPYDLYGNVTYRTIDVFPTVLKDVLEKGGFNYKRVMKDWVLNKFVDIYKDINNKEFQNFSVRFPSGNKKVIRIITDNGGVT